MGSWQKSPENNNNNVSNNTIHINQGQLPGVGIQQMNQPLLNPQMGGQTQNFLHDANLSNNIGNNIMPSIQVSQPSGLPAPYGQNMQGLQNTHLLAQNMAHAAQNNQSNFINISQINPNTINIAQAGLSRTRNTSTSQSAITTSSPGFVLHQQNMPTTAGTPDISFSAGSLGQNNFGPGTSPDIGYLNREVQNIGSYPNHGGIGRQHNSNSLSINNNGQGLNIQQNVSTGAPSAGNPITSISENAAGSIPLAQSNPQDIHKAIEILATSPPNVIQEMILAGSQGNDGQGNSLDPAQSLMNAAKNMVNLGQNQISHAPIGLQAPQGLYNAQLTPQGLLSGQQHPLANLQNVRNPNLMHPGSARIGNVQNVQPGGPALNHHHHQQMNSLNMQANNALQINNLMVSTNNQNSVGHGNGSGSVPLNNGHFAASIGSPIGQGYYFKGDSVPMDTPPANSNNLTMVGSPGFGNGIGNGIGFVGGHNMTHISFLRLKTEKFRTSIKIDLLPHASIPKPAATTPKHPKFPK